MLESLRIENYVLIEKLDLTFGRGFSVITGETGAGKSVLMGAIALILGQRADLKVIKEGCTRCTLEALFTQVSYLKPFFEENDLEYDETGCTVRRELYESGKSRAFVNDSPVTLSILKELGHRLVDVHSQHENLLLGTDGFQREVLDRVSVSRQPLSAYRKAFSDYQQLRQRLSALRRKTDASVRERDYIAFQFKQLEEAHLEAGEQECLESEIELLSHAEEVKSGLQQLSSVLGSEEEGVCTRLKDGMRLSEHLKDIFPPLKETSERMESSLIDLQDLLHDLDRWNDRVEIDPKRLEQCEERLSLLLELQKKHRAASVEELIALRDDLAEQLHHIDHGEEELSALAEEVDHALKVVGDLAAVLSAHRRQPIPGIERFMIAQLQQLGMPHAVFKVELTGQDFDETGADKVSFLFSANKNKMVQPLGEVASGGEISRLMLCVKALIAEQSECSTLLFDEIDTGVSGEIAHRMARLMQDIARHRQVLCITHLPQIAAMGESHYKVYKTEDGEQAISNARQLTYEERIGEIAQMVSHGNPGEAALENARQLLNDSKQ